MHNNNLYERLLAAKQHWKHLVNLQKEMDSNYKKLSQEFSANKLRIELEPEIKALLEKLQHHEHEKSVGAYERLLSALLNDIMPGERKLVMDLSTERGLSALNLFIQKGDNPLEDAYDGTGGSVSNILSVGLRLISLIRSGKRRFMILDESDCWIKPSIVPRFVKVIQEMATNLGVQILMISHHNESFFTAIPNKLYLKKTDSGVEAAWSADSEEPEWNESQEGLRSLYLQNFQSHESTFIPLSPGVTLLCGDNDIGKSAIVSALRAVFYGISNDQLIKHYAEETTVSVDMGMGRLLSWTRKARKGSPKEIYMLTDATHDIHNPLHRSPGEKGAAVPAWLEEETGIGLIDGLDVQLGHQKKPVFLLDESPPTRAKALAIGDDGSYVQKMMKLSKEDLSESRSMIRSAEKVLEKNKQSLFYLDGIEDNHEEKYEERGPLSLFRLYNRQEKIHEEVELLEALQEKWFTNLINQEAYSPLKYSKGDIKDIEISDLYPLHSLYKRWKKSEKDMLSLSLIEGLSDINIPHEPESHMLSDLLNKWEVMEKRFDNLTEIKSLVIIEEPKMDIQSNTLKQLYYYWQTIENKIEIYQSLSLNNHIEIIDNTAELVKLNNLLHKWQFIKEKNEKDSQSVLSLTQEINEIELVIDKEFPVCPGCQRPWEDEHSHGEES